MTTPPPTVFVGLSGGVDSSVAALRLKREGCNVVGVFIKVWHPDWLVCNWEQERLDAMRVAAKLDIPFLTCDAEAAYRDDVAHYFIEEYKAGRTPNPDVMCNKYVKFGRFLDFARNQGADFVATGHYARRIDDGTTATLHRGIDTNKDQTYFLWTLTQSQLQQTLFPVGDSPKDTIRTEAEAAGLLTAEKKDSQGICFLGHIDIVEFLSHYTTLQPGDVLNERGEVIGTHHGALVYTLGQRHGFTITEQSTNQPALYVIARDMTANTITVSSNRATTTAGATLALTEISRTRDWTPTELTGDLAIQTRYRQTPIAVSVVSFSEKEIILQPNETTDTPASGQSCVLYCGSECLGGGIIL
jgi:tRNA-specific 2-thiouridylase